MSTALVVALELEPCEEPCERMSPVGFFAKVRTTAYRLGDRDPGKANPTRSCPYRRLGPIEQALGYPLFLVYVDLASPARIFVRDLRAAGHLDRGLA